MRWTALSVNTWLLVRRKKIGRECSMLRRKLHNRRRGVRREEEGFGKYLRSVWLSMKAYLRQDHLEAILVIFGRSFLIFFVCQFERSWKI